MDWSYWKILQKRWPEVLFLAALILGLFFGLFFLICNIDFKDEPTLYISVFAFITSGISFLISVIFPLIKRPILEVTVEKYPVFSKSQDKNPSSWFHRLYVSNFGLQPAENCIGKLIEIRDESGKRITKFDPIPLYWTHQNRSSVFDPVTIYGRGDFAILDILHETVVTHDSDCKTLNAMKDWDRNDFPEEISRDFIKATEGQLPSLRVYLPDPETFPYYEIHSVSPGTKPILIPGNYFLLIGVYAKNGFAKPEWYRLDIELSSKAEISNSLTKSKSTLKKASKAEKRSLK
jgi:hypothetical protein